MSTIIDIGIARLSPLVRGLTDSQLDFFVDAADDFIRTYCSKYLPTLDLDDPQPIVQQAALYMVGYLYAQTRNNPLFQSQTIPMYSYTKANQLGIWMNALPQTAILLLNMAVIGNAPVQHKTQYHFVPDAFIFGRLVDDYGNPLPYYSYVTEELDK